MYHIWHIMYLMKGKSHIIYISPLSGLLCFWIVFQTGGPFWRALGEPSEGSRGTAGPSYTFSSLIPDCTAITNRYGERWFGDFPIGKETGKHDWIFKISAKSKRPLIQSVSHKYYKKHNRNMQHLENARFPSMRLGCCKAIVVETGNAKSLHIMSRSVKNTGTEETPTSLDCTGLVYCLIY